MVIDKYAEIIQLYKEFVNAECIKFHNIHKYPLNIHKCADAAGSDYAKSQHRTQKRRPKGRRDEKLSVKIEIAVFQECPCHQNGAHLIGVNAIPGNIRRMTDFAVILVQLLEVDEGAAMLGSKLFADRHIFILARIMSLELGSIM